MKKNEKNLVFLMMTMKTRKMMMSPGGILVRAKSTKQGILVILLGIVLLILVGLLYIFGIAPCAMG